MSEITKIQNNYSMYIINILFAIISLYFTACEKETDLIPEGIKPPIELPVELPPISGTPLAWGFDNAGYTPNTELEAVILKDFGFDLVVYHYNPKKSGNEFALKRLSNTYKGSVPPSIEFDPLI